MSFHSSRTLVRSLIPALAAALLHIGTAAASDYLRAGVQPDSRRNVGLIRASGDAQEQARELLLGVRSALPPTAQSAVKAERSNGDAQESARQLLLGVTTPASGPQQSDVSRATQKHVDGDAQLLAREVLLGRL
jgi:hypothetical protein